MARAEFRANGRDYAISRRPVVVICLDGCEPEYLESAMAAGVTPAFAQMAEKGTFRLAHSVIPSFTNPNNLSIATGRPPSVHGICGNYTYDPDTGAEVMMDDVKFLRARTIFAEAQAAGAKVAIVTAKDKLRKLLGAGLRFGGGRAICISAERSGSTTAGEHGLENAADWLGVPVPPVYSADLSEFVFAAGAKLLREWSPDYMYLTTTDYVQHKFAPGDEEANAFHAMFDRYLPQLDAGGASIVVTADHGMKPKHREDGSPAVVYLQDLLESWFGPGSARVILPITDPYVVHHGALGSFATVYCSSRADAARALDRIAGIEEIEMALTREEACRRFELPPDRIGDLVLVSSTGAAIGTSEHRHDLTGLDAPLRSHGGLSEQTVPFLVNARIELPGAPELRNFDAFHCASHAASLEIGP